MKIVAKLIVSVFVQVENIVEKGENAALSCFPTMFSKAFSIKFIKTQDYVFIG